MTMKTIPMGIVVPSQKMIPGAGGLQPKLIDASGEKVAGIFKIPKSGTISKIGIRVGTVTSSQTLRVGLQTVSSGIPTGTAYGGMVAGTQISPATNNWYTVPLGIPASVTAGDTVAVVVEFDSTVGNLEIDYMSGATQGFPYITHNTGSWTPDDEVPAFALEYSDGSYEFTGMLPINGNPNTLFFNSSDTPDEKALRFSVPFPTRAVGFWVFLDTNQTGSYDVVLYEGTTVKETVSFPAERGSSLIEYTICRFNSPVSITKDAEYFLAIKPGAVDVGLRFFTVETAAIMGAMDGGAEFHHGERTDAGAWSKTTTEVPMMGIYFDQFDDGVGGGGGLITHPGMGGGMRG